MSANAPALESAERYEGGRQLGRVEKFSYDNHVVRAFAIATAVWGLVGTLAGLAQSAPETKVDRVAPHTVAGAVSKSSRRTTFAFAKR